MLAGPSTRGLADPGSGACLSLLQTTVCLLGHRPDIDEVVAMLLLQELAPSVQEALLRAHSAHEAESAARQAASPDSDG